MFQFSIRDSQMSIVSFKLGMELCLLIICFGGSVRNHPTMLLHAWLQSLLSRLSFAPWNLISVPKVNNFSAFSFIQFFFLFEKILFRLCLEVHFPRFMLFTTKNVFHPMLTVGNIRLSIFRSWDCLWIFS